MAGQFLHGFADVGELRGVGAGFVRKARQQVFHGVGQPGALRLVKLQRHLDGGSKQVGALLLAAGGELQRLGAQAGRTVGHTQADQVGLR
ncbi:hypothetical protein D3C72_1795530 [compost metagenome]